MLTGLLLRAIKAPDPRNADSDRAATPIAVTTVEELSR
jgi:hypothetical protein